MLEEPKIKKVDKRDKQLPQNFEQLIEMYDVEKIWPYMKKVIDYINKDLEKIKVSPTQPTENEKVWIEQSKNILNPHIKHSTSASYDFTNDTYKLISSGQIYLMCKVVVGETYTLSYKNNNGFASIRASNYNYGGSWIEYGRATTTDGKVTFTATTDTVVVQFINGTANSSTVQKVQLEQSTTATEYEPYVDSNKIYTKDSNGNFKVFMEEDVVVSSTEPSINRGKVWMQYSKNMAKVRDDTQTSNGITRTKISNSEVSIKGTATANAYLGLVPSIFVKANKTYTISVNQSLHSQAFIYSNKSANIGLTYSDLQVINGKTKTFTPTKDGEIDLVLYIYSGRTENFNLQIQVEEGEATEYEPYVDSNKIYTKDSNGIFKPFMEEDVTVSSKEPSINRGKVWIQKGKNLFDEKTKKNGLYNDDGSYTTNPYISTFGPIYVKGTVFVYGTIVGNDVNTRIAEFDKNGNFIKRTFNRNFDNGLKLDANTEFIYVSNNTSPENHYTDFMVSSTKAAYEPYIEKAIYVKNDNGVYEEFYKEPNEVVIKGTLPSTINTEIEMSLPDGFTMNNSYILSWKVIYSDINHQQDPAWVNPYLFNSKLRAYVYDERAVGKEIRIVLKKY